MIKVGTIVQYRPAEFFSCPACSTPASEIKRKLFTVGGDASSANRVPAIVLDNDYPDGEVTLVAFTYSGNKIVARVKEGTAPGTFCLIPAKEAGDRTIAGQGSGAVI